MTSEYLLEKAQLEIEEGLETYHCRECGCMIEALQNIEKLLDSRKPSDFPPDFQAKVKSYIKELKSVESS